MFTHMEQTTPRRRITRNYEMLRRRYRNVRGFDVFFSLRTKYVFFPIGKVANSSLKWALFRAEAQKIKAYEKKWQRRENLVHDQFFGPLVSYFQLEMSPSIVNEAMFGDSFCRFAFVRSPYSRLLAAFLDRAQAKGSQLKKKLRANFGEAEVDFSTFCEFVASHSDPRMLDPHVKPQSLILNGGEVPLDFLGRFEALAEDFSSITKRLYEAPIELGFQSPSRTNATSQLAQYYTPRLIEMVNDIYDDDFRMFGYEKLKTLSD